MLGSFLTLSDVEELKRYKYRSSGITMLDGLLDRAFWTDAAKAVPRSVAPNALTLAGLLACATTYLLFIASVQFAQALTPMYLIAAVLLLLQLMMDALDGKHARNTGRSSPLGQILDHGCDAFSCMFVVFTVVFATRTWHLPVACMYVTVVQLQVVCYTWWEHVFGIFRCSTGPFTGVVEGHLLTTSVILAGGLFGPDVYELRPLKLLGSVPQIGEASFVMIYFVFSIATLSLGCVLDLSRGMFGATDKRDALSFACSGIAHVILQAPFWLSVMETRPILGSAIMSANFSLLVLRMMLITMCKKRGVDIHWPLFPFYVVCLMCVFPMGDFLQGMLLWLVFGWVVVYLLCFVARNLRIICDGLRIRVFSLEGEASRSAKVPRHPKRP